MDKDENGLSNAFEEEKWNVFFIINVSDEISGNDIIKIKESFTEIIKVYRSSRRINEKCLVNVIIFGNNEAQEIIIAHPIALPINLNLKFGGKGDVHSALYILHKRIEEIKLKNIYSPTAITFIKKSIDQNLEKELFSVKKSLSFRPFNFDYPEIYLGEYIDDNYLIFLEKEDMKNLNPLIGNGVYYENIKNYLFQGEIKEYLK